MDHIIKSFLKDREITRGTPLTHTSKIKPCRSYNISDEDLDEFFTHYNTAIADGATLGITEQPENICPLIVDIDFKCSADGGLKRYYSSEMVRKIVEIYQNIIRDITTKITDKMLYCCVLTKTGPRMDRGTCKDGFHLHFPFFYAERWVQLDYIREQAIQKVKEAKLFEKIPTQQTINQIFDKNVPKNCWLLYGSVKEPGMEPYRLTKTYDGDGDSIRLKNVFKDKYPTGSREWNLPRYLSVRQGYTPTELKANILKKKSTKKVWNRVTHTRGMDPNLLRPHYL